MPTEIRNKCAEERIVHYGLPGLRKVRPGGTFFVPDDVAESYLSQTDLWEKAETAAPTKVTAKAAPEPTQEA